MKFDVLIYDCESIFDADEQGVSLIRVGNMEERDAMTLARMLWNHGVNACVALRWE